MKRLKGKMRGERVPHSARVLPGSEVLYTISVRDGVHAHSAIEVKVWRRERRKGGSYSSPKPLRIDSFEINDLPNPTDRLVLGLLHGGDHLQSEVPRGLYAWTPGSFTVSGDIAREVLKRAAAEKRLYRECGTKGDPLEGPLTWDEGEPWSLHAVVRPDDGGYRMHAELRRASESRLLTDARFTSGAGFWLLENELHRLTDDLCVAWQLAFKGAREVSVPKRDGDELVKLLFGLPRVPELELPEELRFQEIVATPAPRIVLRKPERPAMSKPMLRARVGFDYGEIEVQEGAVGRLAIDPDRRMIARRDLNLEQRHELRLFDLGFRAAFDAKERRPQLELPPARLAPVVAALVAEGWKVDADGQVYRTMDRFDLSLSSGVDWFDLQGAAVYGELTAPLPELLRALRRGERTVRLGDGTLGMLPEEWLRKYARLAAFGREMEDVVRFEPRQVGILDALLSALPEVPTDARFEKARARLRAFERIAPIAPGESFKGELRVYQQEALGWLRFLRDFEFGGCLADDMGLGKTVVALALLEERRGARRKNGPSLVVVPNSLVFNWQSEAAAFAPRLRVTAHVGTGRGPLSDALVKSDLLVTTYGTLRRDILELKEAQFDYVILDESQAIKNSDTDTAKCVRLLPARHRLALSGTPIENHLGELWSLFEFLNPGLLGSEGPFRSTAGDGSRASGEELGMIAKGLRPFILRRTKEQVAKDLPRRIEQTISGEMGPRQAELYAELLEHYRGTLLADKTDEAFKKSKLLVLEGLLRLRQAASHPGLIHERYRDVDSIKLDLLLPKLQEVMEEGHKALIFSQFTSFLALVRERLDALGVEYEYLDGKTRDRKARVERFQKSDQTKLFLISLKAGGVGLNLTSADYVFLLDPWWNPAVEAQAIDRTHRIGQTRTVMAYRLIARGTVEEKILELQKSKRALADAIIGEDNSLIRNLSREDLALLLS
ncbi:MAG: DEAD/DEAH box helicase [Candidatus Eisenbacteria bacterium]|nr:DEAD/DEAH box helicase [Candidatus Eisenbacteria bacterium]